MADLSLPDAIHRLLAPALQEMGYRIGPDETKPNADDNVIFHRVVGLKDTRPTSIALLYITQEEIQKRTDRWFVYSLCVRVCQAQRSWDADLSAVLFLRPSSLTLPGDWTQQIKDFSEIGAVSHVDHFDVPPPDRWINPSVGMGKHYATHCMSIARVDPLETPAVPDRMTGPRQAAPAPREAVDALPQPLVFVSYASADESQCKLLYQALQQLKWVFKDPVWLDKMIPVGAEWNPEIERNLETAKVVVMLVTQNFLNSGYIHGHEFTPTLEAHRRKEKSIVWIPGDSCAWRDTPLKDIQAALTVPLDQLKDGNLTQSLQSVYDRVRDLLRDKYGAQVHQR